MGWLGVVGLLICGLVFEVGSVFPGWVALWPVGCAVLVLAAGWTDHPWGIDRFLGSRPLPYLGNLSFTLYLWRWPILVLCLVASGSTRVAPLIGLGMIARSLVLAAITHHALERPMIAPAFSIGAGYRLGSACLVALLLVSGGWQLETNRRSHVDGQLGDPNYPGAAALVNGPVAAAPLLPAPVTVNDDWVSI